MKPEQIRIIRHGESFTILATWGLLHVTTYSTTDWEAFLKRHDWMNVPRVWQAK